MLVFSGETLAGPNDLTMVVVGQKDQVLAVIHKSLETEFSNSTISNWSNGRVGYWAQFSGFFTGITNIGVGLAPLADGDAMEATAYLLDFSWKTQHNDGMRHIRTLKNQIAKQGELLGGVSVTSNPESYRLLNLQSEECFKKTRN